jgi:hypothetical protein
MIGGLAVLAIGLGVAPIASAQPPTIDNCTTSIQNNGRDSYTYCDYTDDSGRYRIVTTCLGGDCTTREAH